MTDSKLYERYSGYLSPGLLGLYLLLNLDVLQDLAGKWLAQGLTGTYSHGPLLALVVVYLVYKKIRQLQPAIKLNPSWYGLAMLLAAQGMLLIARLIDVNFAQHLLLVAGILAIVWALHTFSLVRHFLLPAALFVLSFPVWGSLAVVLQGITVHLTNFVLGLSTVPYYRVDEFFHLPNGIFEVAGSCSGLQQFLVAIIIGLLYIAPYNFGFMRRIRIMIYIALLAVLLNTIRVVTIIFIGYFTEMRSTLVEEHVMLGWVIFGIGIYGFLFLYDRRQLPAAAAVPEQLSTGKGANAGVMRHMPLIVLLAVLAPPAWSLHVEHVINSRKTGSTTYQINAQGWHRLASNIAINWEPAYPAGDELLRETLQHDGKKVYLYINRFTHRHADAEAINMSHAVYDKQHWVLRKHEHIVVPQADGGQVTLPLYQIESKQGREHLSVLTWYVINGRVTHNLLQAKLYQLTGLLTYRYDVKVVAVAVRTDGSSHTIRNILLRFYRDVQILCNDPA